MANFGLHRGQLESDPSITIQTGPFPTKREAHEEFKKRQEKSSMIDSGQ